MAPKKIVKRIKRSLPPKKDGFDPGLVALGAIGGGVVGARRGYNKGVGEVKRSMMSTAKEEFMLPRGTTPYYKRDKSVWGGDLKLDRYGTAAVDAAYKGKVKGYASSQLGDVLLRGAQEKAYGNKPTVDRSDARELAKAAARTKGTSRRKTGGIKGAIGGAALAALVQLVAKELNKK